MKNSALVTGSCGLIGSEVALFFARQCLRIVGAAVRTTPARSLRHSGWLKTPQGAQ